MTIRYLRAEELAQMAGLAKSTILSAIRRGEIRSSRTAGRSMRISIEMARTFLTHRGCDVPDELREEQSCAIAVVSERRALIDAIRGECPPSQSVVGGDDAYAMLLWLGLNHPASVWIDLEMRMLNPFDVIRVLRARRKSNGPRIVAIGNDPNLVAAARAIGANEVVLGEDALAIRRSVAVAWD